MAAPVWVLSVDLQTKTATFQSGMADAAKAARGSFSDIKQGAAAMGRDTSYSMMEARHGVMILGEEFGIRLPRALSTFIAGLGPIGAAMEAAFPFLAIIALAALFVEHLHKMKEEGEKLTEAQMHFGAVTANVLNALDEKLIEAGIRADELSGNHLAALEKQLQLIDRQSLKELERSFEELAKASDATMAQLKAHWYQFGTGSQGAQHALDQFKQKYDLLLAQGKNAEASDLLAGTLKSAERILALQKQVKGPAKGDAGTEVEQFKYYNAIAELKKAGTGVTEKEVQAQETLVDTLRAQAEAEQKVNDLKKLEDSNARGTTDKAIGADEDKLARAQSESLKREQEIQDKMWEQHYREAVDALQQNEREKIAATEQGTQARLNAIDAAIKEENSKGLQETGFYKELLTQRVDTARQMADEEAKLRAEAGREAADHAMKMGELQIDQERYNASVALAMKRKGDDARVHSDEELENEEYKIKMDAFNADIAALDAHAKDYENKLKAIQDRQEELTREHETKLTQIRDKAEVDRSNRILSAEQRFNDTIASQLAGTLLRHQTFSRMMVSLGDEVAAGMLQNAIKSILADDMTKEHDAAAAARKAFKAGEDTVPGVAGVILGGALAAAAFASVMAFQEGGLVPGVGIGDIVPAKLEPGETVIPKKMTEQLQHAADPDASSARPVQVHIHHTPVIQALDSQGMDRVLQKHAGTLQRHFEHTLRKMNR